MMPFNVSTPKFVRLALSAALFVLCAVPSQAVGGWMTERAMRADFIGQELAGYYADGRTWTETYHADGGISYREVDRQAMGQWSFRGSVFCTFYGPGFAGACWFSRKTSTNCYEFFLATREPEGDIGLPKRFANGHPPTRETATGAGHPGV